MVTYKRRSNAWDAKLGWDTSIGQACSATVELGLILLFSCTRADWMSVIFKTIKQLLLDIVLVMRRLSKEQEK